MCRTNSIPGPVDGLSFADRLINTAGSRTETAAVIVVTEAVGGRLVEQLATSSVGCDSAEINWPATLRATGRLSGGERRLIAIAASLAGAEPVDLADALTGLDTTSSRVVLEALAYAMGFNRPTKGRQ